MRHLKIETKKNFPSLENIPEEFQIVEQIARRYAVSEEELKSLYQIGAVAFENFKRKTDQQTFDEKVCWIVRQTIISVIKEYRELY